MTMNIKNISMKNGSVPPPAFTKSQENSRYKCEGYYAIEDDYGWDIYNREGRRLIDDAENAKVSCSLYAAEDYSGWSIYNGEGYYDVSISGADDVKISDLFYAAKENYWGWDVYNSYGVLLAEDVSDVLLGATFFAIEDDYGWDVYDEDGEKIRNDIDISTIKF